MKRQLMEWEKIFAIDVTDKVLIPKIYSQLIQLNNTEPNNPVKKQAEVHENSYNKDDLMT